MTNAVLLVYLTQTTAMEKVKRNKFIPYLYILSMYTYMILHFIRSFASMRMKRIFFLLSIFHNKVQ